MKNIKLFFVLTIALSINIYALFPPSVGVLTKIVQKVEYKSIEKENWDNAQLGGIVYNGDEIRTGNRSLALLKFLDNSLLRVRENSIVTIYGTKEETKLNKNTFIQQGKIGFEISKQKDEEFKFTTPTGVASIRGTKGYFNVPVDGSMLVFVEEGIIEIESSRGSKASGSVNQGEVAKIDVDGNLNIEPVSDEIRNEYETLMKDETKRVRIKLNNGEEYILEYIN